jgi:Leucine Rich repeats (2 copies)
LKDPQLSSIGKSVKNNDDRFNTTCGDHYVAQVKTGAKLFFSIRIDFKNQQTKESFNAKFSISGPAAGVSTTLAQASQTFGQNAVVTVVAHQVGGDVSKLTDLFRAANINLPDKNHAPLVQCQLGHFEQCSQVLEGFLIYASDTKKGFPSQLAPNAFPGPAVLQYITAPYTALGIYPKGFPILTQATEIARNQLSDLFKNQYQAAVAARRLLGQKNIDARRPLIEAAAKKVNDNIATILPIAKTCYEKPSDCFSSVRVLKLAPINLSIFAPASFEQLCDESLILSSKSLSQTFSIIAQTFEPSAVIPDSPQACHALFLKVSNIKKLKIDGISTLNGIDDLSPLATLTNLKSLTIVNAHVSDIGQLSGLFNLQSLSLDNNRISDLSPLSDLTELQILSLYNNNVDDLTGIKSLHRLRKLVLTTNSVTDVSPLFNLPNLIWLDLRANPVLKNEKMLKDLIEALPQSATILPVKI